MGPVPTFATAMSSGAAPDRLVASRQRTGGAPGRMRGAPSWARCAMAVVVTAACGAGACKRHEPVPGVVGSASASAGAAPSAATCLRGEVGSCARCGDRCGSGFCRAGRCAAAPIPFAGPVTARVLTFSGDGFIVAEGESMVRYVAGVEPMRLAGAEFVPRAFADGKFYGVWGGHVLVAKDPREEPVDLGHAMPIDEAVAAVGAEVFYARGAGVGVLREGKHHPLPPRPTGAVGEPRDLAVGPNVVYLASSGVVGVFSGGVANVHGALSAWDRDGQHPRLIATGSYVLAVTTDAQRVYWSDGRALYCARHRHPQPRRFLELPTAVVALGTAEKDLFVATRAQPDRSKPPVLRLYRIPLPVCAD